MATQTWVPGTTGQWDDAANWTPATVPGVGDTAVIAAGNPIIDGLTIQGVSIVLGGSESASSVTLTASGATIAGSGSGQTEVKTSLTVSGGTRGPGLQAIFDVEGAVVYDGLVFVGAPNGGLTVEVASGDSFMFDNADGKAVMVVYQESTLTFSGATSGGTIINDGIIQVDGGLHIASGVTFSLSATASNTSGQAAVLLENGGNALIGGSVGSGEFFDFIDSTGKVTLQSGAVFSGTFGFAPGALSNTIDVQGIVATSLTFVSSSNTEPGILELRSGGQVVAQFSVALLDGNFAPFSAGQTLDLSDFMSTSDGHGGTLITYTPDVPQRLYQSLPVTIQASSRTLVPLSSILEQSFGTADPHFANLTLIKTDPFSNTSSNIGYWSEPDVSPKWYVRNSAGVLVAIGSNTVVSNIADVWLEAGNQIATPAAFSVLVTSGATLRTSEEVVYDAWTVDPRIAAGVASRGNSGTPTPQAVVAAAYTFNDLYGPIPNNNLCNSIADNVAAGAGASLPPENAAIDPALNESGGFWRIVYRGDIPDPVSNWSTLVQPGDIVRMGWFHPEQGVASGHTTTVLGTLNSDGEILFYDNIASDNGVEVIGIHFDNYWTRTDPVDITIYRLDPNSQYLIIGSDFSEHLQGTIYNDLIQPGGGDDTITTGPGRDEIQGTIAELANITVTDFDPGDSVDFTDLALDQASVTYSGGALHVASNGTEVATLHVAAPQSGHEYVLAFDGNSGTSVQLGIPVESGDTLTVSSGQSSSGVIVASGGTEVVLSGGIASGNTVWRGGTILVSGGETVGDVLSGRGDGESAQEIVLSGGVASGVTVSNAGLLTVSAGGLAAGALLVSGTTISSAGDAVLVVSSGGAARGTQIRVGGELVQLGGVDSDTEILSGGEETVSAGSAISTTIFNGGTQTVLSGGSAGGVTVSDGGVQVVSSGGTASGTTVSSGGTLVEAGGAAVVSTTLRVGATYEIVSGAAVSGFGATRGLVLEVGTGGTATGTTVGSSGGTVVNGGSAVSAIVRGGGTALVQSGGHTSGDVLSGSGSTLVALETVASGGVASGVVLSNTGLLLVLSGGSAVDVVAHNSAGVVVQSGGMVSNVFLESGAYEALSGGTAIGTVVGNGAIVSVTSGMNSGAVIFGGGTVLVRGGVDSAVTVLNSGHEVISSGGGAVGTIVSSGGSASLLSGGTASAFQISGGGIFRIFGGIDSGATVSSGGHLVISGGTDLGASVLAGGELVLSGGTASASVLSSGGSETVSSGGLTVSTTILGGARETVLAGGTASNTVVSNGGLALILTGGIAQGTVLSAGGQDVVSSGGQAVGTVVGSGGSELVSSGGVANGATILNGGSQTVLKGGALSGTTVSSGGHAVVSSGGVARGAVVSAGGFEVVTNGGTASGTTILGGATETVSSGGVATSTTIIGGVQAVLGRATANGTVVSSGGEEDVAGTANGTVVSAGGSAVVSSGGQANSLVIRSGGSATVLSGGAVSGVTLSGGTLDVDAGGLVSSSTISFSGGGTLVIDDTKFRGKIAGFNSVDPDFIDLTALNFATVTLGYSGNTMSGTLSVGDGSNTIKLAMIGNYTVASFHAANDGFGHVLISDPASSGG